MHTHALVLYVQCHKAVAVAQARTLSCIPISNSHIRKTEKGASMDQLCDRNVCRYRVTLVLYIQTLSYTTTLPHVSLILITRPHGDDNAKWTRGHNLTANDETN